MWRAKAERDYDKRQTSSFDFVRMSSCKTEVGFTSKTELRPLDSHLVIAICASNSLQVIEMGAIGIGAGRLPQLTVEAYVHATVGLRPSLFDVCPRGLFRYVCVMGYGPNSCQTAPRCRRSPEPCDDVKWRCTGETYIQRLACPH